MNILVTGGASGLGAAIVAMLANDSSHSVWFTYARSAEAAAQLEATYPNTHALHCDFTDTGSVDVFISALSTFDIDVLINNAYGGMHKEYFYKTDAATFARSFEYNVVPVLRITQQAFKIFRKKKFGKIINIISSAIINKPPIGWAEYTANKAYLQAMSTAWATEGIRFNITSNSISPSFMETNLTSDTDERIVEQMRDDHPLKQLLTTAEVANAVQFLVSATQHINGSNMIINAGADIG